MIRRGQSPLRVKEKNDRRRETSNQRNDRRKKTRVKESESIPNKIRSRLNEHRKQIKIYLTRHEPETTPTLPLTIYTFRLPCEPETKRALTISLSSEPYPERTETSPSQTIRKSSGRLTGSQKPNLVRGHNYWIRYPEGAYFSMADS